MTRPVLSIPVCLATIVLASASLAGCNNRTDSAGKPGAGATTDVPSTMPGASMPQPRAGSAATP